MSFLTVYRLEKQMVRMDYKVDLQYQTQGPCEFVLNVCPARTRAQRVVAETLEVDGATPTYTFTDPIAANRINRLYCNGGPVAIRYRGTVELNHYIGDPATIAESAVRTMPSEVVPYILPSRYCPSDKMGRLALAMFGNAAPGYARVASICEWVRQHVAFKSGASDATSCAIDTFDSRVGVCRDYAHLMISMCRALNIPARYVTGADYGADPALGPTDFHAYVEVFLGQRWYLFDPSGISPVMGLIRIGTGHDAADVSFATLFGNIKSHAPVVSIELVAGDEAQFETVDSLQRAVSTATESLYHHVVQAPSPQSQPSSPPPSQVTPPASGAFIRRPAFSPTPAARFA
ncbi:MAG: transglutaminase family protein [Phycisphaerae bacterium]|nr:transglutaminase family protein [Gemmatimonadaceae bacterium]